MKTTLTIVQSARLIKLGIDPSKASMVSWKLKEDWQRKSVLGDKEHLQPKPFRPMVMGFERFEVKDVFSLTDLLAILPKEIEKDDKTYTLHTQWSIHGDFSSNHQWLAFYSDGFLVESDHSAPELIDSLYSLLIWAIENGHLKTDKK